MAARHPAVFVILLVRGASSTPTWQAWLWQEVTTACFLVLACVLCCLVLARLPLLRARQRELPLALNSHCCKPSRLRSASRASSCPVGRLAPGGRTVGVRHASILLLVPWLAVCTAAGTICSNEPTVCDGTYSGIDLYYDVRSLSGTVPTQLGAVTGLTGMGFDDNSLSGTVPTQLGAVTALTYGMRFSSNSLSGTLPTQLGALTALWSMSLYSNSLSGSLPTQLGVLTALNDMYLAYNSLSGSLPTQLFALTELTLLYLNDNSLSGSLPTQLGALTTLRDMRLNSNSLSGSLPTQLGALTTLRDMYLDGNSLSGTIPQGLPTPLSCSISTTNSYQCPLPDPSTICTGGISCTWASLPSSLPSPPPRSPPPSLLSPLSPSGSPPPPSSPPSSLLPPSSLPSPPPPSASPLPPGIAQSPSPLPPPPLPSPPPPSPGAATTTSPSPPQSAPPSTSESPSTEAVILTIIASGDVSDYADTSSLRQNIANAAGLEDASLVTISVTAASVIITATIAVPASTTASAVQSALASELPTAAAASTALGITVEGTPTIVLAPSSAAAPPAPPGPSSTGGGNGVIIAAAVGCGGVVALVMLVGAYRMRIKRLRHRQVAPQTAPAKHSEAQLVHHTPVASLSSGWSSTTPNDNAQRPSAEATTELPLALVARDAQKHRAAVHLLEAWKLSSRLANLNPNPNPNLNPNPIPNLNLSPNPGTCGLARSLAVAARPTSSQADGRGCPLRSRCSVVTGR